MKTHDITKNGVSIRMFYDPHARVWTVYAIDSDENQITDAHYCAHKDELDGVIKDIASMAADKLKEIEA